MKPVHTACRIAVVCPWFYRGDAVGHSAHDYYHALRALGCTQVRAIGTRNDFPDMLFERCDTLDELVRNEWYANADLVIYHYAIYHEYFEALRRKPRGGRHVVCFHNVTPRHLMPESTWDIIDKSFAQLLAFEEADEIWGDSRENIEELKRRGIRRPPMRVIPIAVERPPLMALTDKQRLPIELLYVGRFFSSKGIIDLVDATSRLRGLVSRPFLLRLVGNTDFSDRKYIEAVGAQIRLHGLGENIDFVGKVDEPTLFRLYHRAHVFVNASYHEGFCVPVIESLRGGLIPVTYRAGNLRWIAGGHGRTVETGDVEALAMTLADIVEAIGAALERPGEPLLPLDNGRKTAVQFSVEAMEYARRFEFKRFTEHLDDALSGWIAGMAKSETVGKPNSALASRESGRQC